MSPRPPSTGIGHKPLHLCPAIHALPIRLSAVMYPPDETTGQLALPAYNEEQLNKLENTTIRSIVLAAAAKHLDVGRALDAEADRVRETWPLWDENFSSFMTRAFEALYRIDHDPRPMKEVVPQRIEYLAMLFREMACRCQPIRCTLRTKIDAINAMCHIIDLVEIGKGEAGYCLRLSAEIFREHVVAAARTFTPAQRQLAYYDADNPIARLEQSSYKSIARAAGVEKALAILRGEG